MRRAQQLGRYHLLDRIAFGGMAEVYRAKTFDASGHAHLVAVKRILAHLAEDDDFIQMLVDEAKIAGQLRHPNIARIYEFARSNDGYFIAMEHVDGKDLRGILERCRENKRPMDSHHAAYICSEIAAALQTAHAATDSTGAPMNIVHRDVSPSNIICSYTGEVKLCDFGIAKATLSQVQTRTGVIKGKVKYMSPEQALGRKLDHRSDIFSLGTVLYEMLTRIPPFTATNEMDLLIKVRDAKFRPIREIVPNVPPEIEKIANKCLSRSRASRFQSAADLRRALRHYLQNSMPSYGRSHLGSYVRTYFTQEIEDELRMLEEYVVVQASNDVGENLISNALGPDAEFEQFSPHANGTQLDDGPQSLPKTTTQEDIVIENELHSSMETGVENEDPEEEATIIDPSGLQTRDTADHHASIPRAIPPSVKRPKRPQSLPDTIDPVLHNAPTLIIDINQKSRPK